MPERIDAQASSFDWVASLDRETVLAVFGAWDLYCLTWEFLGSAHGEV